MINCDCPIFSGCPMIKYLVLTIALLALMAGQVMAESKIYTEYDRYKGTTTTETRQKDVALGFLESLYVKVYTVFDENDNSRVYIIRFYRFGTGWAYQKVSKVYFLLDGERYIFSDPQIDGHVKSGGDTKEWVYFFIDRETIRRFANASLIEGKLGSTKFKFTEKHMVDLKGLDAFIEKAKN